MGKSYKEKKITYSIEYLYLVVMFLFTMKAQVFSNESAPIIGTVYQKKNFNNEIIISSSLESDKLEMGDAVYVKINNKIILMKVTFPMQTVARCKLLKHNQKYFKSIKRGVFVYLYKRGNTLDKIKKDFTRVDKILLYNKKIIYGAIIHRGKKYIIMTINGRVEVPQKSILSVKVIK